MANSEVQFASDLVERVYVLPLLRAATRTTQGFGQQVPNFADLLRIAQSSVDPPMVCQGPQCGRLVHKTRRLLCKPDAIAISLTFPSACPDDLTLKQVIDLIEPTIEPARLYTSSSQFAEPFKLSGIICYHGQHYLAICYHSTRQVWNVISDSVVKLIGSTWGDVRNYLRRAPCIPCLLLYTNPQAAPLPQAAVVQQHSPNEPIYFDRQAVQDMLARQLKFPTGLQLQNQSSVAQTSAQSKSVITSSETDSSSGYGSNHDSGASSCSPKSGSSAASSASSSGVDSPVSKGSLDRLSASSLPKLIAPSDQNVSRHYQHADSLCTRLMAQISSKQYSEALVTCQQAANTLRSALFTPTTNGGTLLDCGVDNPHVVSAKERIDWLAHNERSILRKLNTNISTSNKPPVSTFTTFQRQKPTSIDKVELQPPRKATLSQLKSAFTTSAHQLRESLPSLPQQLQVSKEAEDVPDRCTCSNDQSSGTLPRGLRLSPSSSDILSSSSSSPTAQLKIPSPAELTAGLPQ